jgi:hypothetical protein
MDIESELEGDDGGSESDELGKPRARLGLMFRLAHHPRQSDNDTRPVTTAQHILGLAKLRQVSRAFARCSLFYFSVHFRM